MLLQTSIATTMSFLMAVHQRFLFNAFLRGCRHPLIEGRGTFLGPASLKVETTIRSNSDSDRANDNPKKMNDNEKLAASMI